MRTMDDRWGRLKVLGALTMIAFAVALAVVVGNRLSEEALGVLAGAVCGVGAAIPTSLIVVAVSKRQQANRSSYPRPTEKEPDRRAGYPPVVVVSPGSAQPEARSSWNRLPASITGPADREFRVVGGASLEDGEVRYGS